ncbi:glutamate receptor ionotropic, kainate 2-like isoform X2 [Hermetia illucens]|uniref:glutamate receptor ionotropic, kainate 2-like isoform X2 n=1 Tax=Hermetia illucens TaxID=343691 RepID=UPI0018CC4902|nr:glutamate receptor ionotropic, kainate 2-like isoform X2 [Hermetia illucens]
MWKIFLVLVLCEITAGKRQLPVGGLFTLDEIDEVIAFRTTINRVNDELLNFELVPIVRYITAEDSFVLEQITCDIVAEGAIAVFGPSSGKASAIVNSICHNKGIPHILFSWRDEETREEKLARSMTVNVYPELMGLSEAYADVIRNYQWTAYLVLYDSSEGLKKLQDVIQLPPPQQPIAVLPIGDGPDYRPLWKDVKEYGENRFVVDCSLDKVIDFLSQARDFELIGEDQHFLLTNFDTHTLPPSQFKQFPSNITSVKISAPEHLLRETTYDWMDYELKRGVKYEIDERRVKTSMILIHDAVQLLAKALRSDYSFVDMDLPNVDCDTRTTWDAGQHLYKIMKLMTHNNSMVRELEGFITGRMDMNEYGDREFFKMDVTMFFSETFHKLVTWNRDEGIVDTKMRGIITEKLSEAIQNKTFKISTRLGDPFLMLRTPKDGEVLEGNARYEGYVVDLMHSLSERLGFKYELKLVPDGKYGSINKDTRKWDGIIRQLIEGKADIGICDLTITLERRQAVDFTVPFMSLGISILYAKPVKKPPNLFSFMLPFSFDVWVNTVAIYLVISLLLFAIARISNDEWESPHPCNPDPEEVENIWNVSNSSWLTMGSIMGQGCDLLPKGGTMRLITGMWWFFALMLLNSYTANLAAFLTMSRMDVAIRNVEDLSKQAKIKYGVVQGGSTMSFFRVGLQRDHLS